VYRCYLETVDGGQVEFPYPDCKLIREAAYVEELHVPERTEIVDVEKLTPSTEGNISRCRKVGEAHSEYIS
jgi:hypothetical protein